MSPLAARLREAAADNDLPASQPAGAWSVPGGEAAPGAKARGVSGASPSSDTVAGLLDVFGAAGADRDLVTDVLAGCRGDSAAAADALAALLGPPEARQPPTPKGEKDPFLVNESENCASPSATSDEEKEVKEWEGDGGAGRGAESELRDSQAMAGGAGPSLTFVRRTKVRWDDLPPDCRLEILSNLTVREACCAASVCRDFAHLAAAARHRVPALDLPVSAVATVLGGAGASSSGGAASPIGGRASLLTAALSAPPTAPDRDPLARLFAVHPRARAVTLRAAAAAGLLRSDVSLRRIFRALAGADARRQSEALAVERERAETAQAMWASLDGGGGQQDQAGWGTNGLVGPRWGERGRSALGPTPYLLAPRGPAAVEERRRRSAAAAAAARAADEARRATVADASPKAPSPPVASLRTAAAALPLPPDTPVSVCLLMPKGYRTGSRAGSSPGSTPRGIVRPIGVPATTSPHSCASSSAASPPPPRGGAWRGSPSIRGSGGISWSEGGLLGRGDGARPAPSGSRWGGDDGVPSPSAGPWGATPPLTSAPLPRPSTANVKTTALPSVSSSRPPLPPGSPPVRLQFTVPAPTLAPAALPPRPGDAALRPGPGPPRIAAICLRALGQELTDDHIAELVSELPTLRELRVSRCSGLTDASLLLLAAFAPGVGDGCPGSGWDDDDDEAAGEQPCKAADGSLDPSARTAPYRRRDGICSLQAAGLPHVTDAGALALVGRTAPAPIPRAVRSSARVSAPGFVSPIAPRSVLTLSRLDLSRCQRLTSAAVQGLLRAPHLEVLRLNECKGITSAVLLPPGADGDVAPVLLGTPAAHHSLRELSLAGCPRLSIVALAAPLLESLNVTGCPRLSTLDLRCPRMRSLQAALCPALNHAVPGLQPPSSSISAPGWTRPGWEPATTAHAALADPGVAEGPLAASPLPPVPPLPDGSAEISLPQLPLMTWPPRSSLVCFFSLIELNVSGCRALLDAPLALLQRLCPNLRGLNVSGCGGLQRLDLEEGGPWGSTTPQLVRLDVSGCRHLESLRLGWWTEPSAPSRPDRRCRAALRSLAARGCASLGYVAVPCAALRSLDLTNCDTLVVWKRSDPQNGAPDALLTRFGSRHTGGWGGDRDDDDEVEDDDDFVTRRLPDGRRLALRLAGVPAEGSAAVVAELGLGLA